jgi:hypothetical protein
MQIIVYADRLKEKANALYRLERFDYALRKFEVALQALKAFRDEQSDAQAARIRALQAALHSNCAATLMAKKACF